MRIKRRIFRDGYFWRYTIQQSLDDATLATDNKDKDGNFLRERRQALAESSRVMQEIHTNIEERKKHYKPKEPPRPRFGGPLFVQKRSEIKQ